VSKAETTNNSNATIAEAITFVTVIYVLSRMALLLAADAISSLHPNLPIPRVLAPWDSTFYISIAKSGYPVHVAPSSVNSEPIAFFPFYPLLGKAAAFVLRTHTSITLEVVSMLAGALSAAMATAVAKHYSDIKTARRTGVFFALFPGSVISVLAYADALAVMLCLATFLLLIHKRYILAGLAAALATATLSLIVLPLLLFIIVYSIRNKSYKSLITLFLSATGGGAYLLYLWIATGSLFTWSQVEHDHWLVHLSLPWDFGTAFSAYAFTYNGSYVLTVLSIAVTALGLYALWKMHAPLEWVVFSLVVICAVTFDGGAWIAPRFIYDTPPMVIALGILSSKKVFFIPVCIICFLCLIGLLFAYTPGNIVFVNP